MVERELIKSKAYASLKVHGLKVLLRFYTKRKMEKHKHPKRGEVWNISNNGDLVFTYKEAVQAGMDRKQFSGALDELISKGFLEITHHGTGPGDSSTYKLTERWKIYGKEQFKPAPSRRKNTDPNMGWAKYNALQKQNPGVENDTSSSVKMNTSSMIKSKMPVSKTTPANRDDNAVIY